MQLRLLGFLQGGLVCLLAPALGSKRKTGRYFGPFPSAGAVRDSLNILQKLFRLRHCEDTFFKNRSRPCLQYQIQRCSGPCVGLIEPDQYREDVELALARSRPIHFLNRMGGMLVSPDEVVAKVKAMIEGSSEEVHIG